MKHSIRTRITLMLTTMIILTIFITWFINRTFLSDFYIKSKKDTLNEAYSKISSVIENSKDKYSLTDEELNLLEQYEQKYDVDAYVFSSKFEFIFPAPEYIGLREYQKADEMFRDAIGLSSINIDNKKILRETDNYFVYSYAYHDRQISTNGINLFGLTNKSYKKDSSEADKDRTQLFKNNNFNIEITQEDNLILMTSNFDSIGESVKIANEFLAYVGIIAALIGSALMYMISKRFTKPILELAGIAKRMSNLDFEVEYSVKSRDEIGELGTSINILSDRLESTITELKQANNELMTDIQRKTELDEMRKEFLSNVSHELKTPISLIQGYAEGLKENINEDEESRDFYCEVIMDEANKMNNMVKKLLSLNELEFGNNQVNFDRFDIVVLIKSVLNATEILFKQKEAVLRFEQVEPVYVWADEFLIEQVVTNYISNALNHVSGQKFIEIKLIPRGDILRVAVFNTGDNIPEDELNKIWIKFYKVDKARTREYGGSGIGLSIVKAIMNTHNKECGVINHPVGVEFWFELDMKS